MYIAGRTRTASRPSRIRMASAPYSPCSSSAILVFSVIPSLLSGRPDFPPLHREEPALRAQPLRPRAVGGGHQRLPAAPHFRTEGGRPLLVELGVEVVEEGDRRRALLRRVHLQGGQAEGQEETPALAGGGVLGGLDAIHRQPDLVPVRSHQRTAGPALVATARLDLIGQAPGLRRLVLERR